VSSLVRFSVSLESDLLARFDRHCEQGKFPTRSEAIRQLLHDTLTEQAFAEGAEDIAGTITLVYDHHRPNLSQRLLELQHRHGGIVLATTHVHLAHDSCLEVIIMRGPAAALLETAAELRGLKGIRTGQLVLAATGEVSSGHAHHGAG
jgi:CopG family transcriptional regulator, nickel-responsive regulator